MNHPQRFFGMWTGLTTAFIVIAVVTSSLLTVHQFLEFEKESRRIHKKLIQSEIAKDYSTIVEEAYLRLGSLQLHEENLAGLIGSKGNLKLHLEIETVPQAITSELPDHALEWVNSSSDEDTFKVPLFFGDLFIGTLHGAIVWKHSGFIVGGNSLATGIAVLMAVLALSWILLSSLLKQKVLTPLLQEFVRLQRSGAVAETIQMLAHDVRKPFSILKVTLESLQQERNSDRLKEVIARLLPEVRRAVSSVNGMIIDVMELGSNSQLSTEPECPERLVENTLNEFFRDKPFADIVFNYRFEHRYRVNVDALRIARVFSNIIENASQAMDHKGEMWFRTREVTSGEGRFCELCIGNSGSYIPESEIAKLFEPFYTKGKRGGTGLGLAIAEKVITSHGGLIWCRSSRERGTEFFFSLPCSDLPSARPLPRLPFSTKEIRHRYDETAAEVGGELSVSLWNSGNLERLRNFSVRHGRPFQIQIIDDDLLYAQSVGNLVQEGGLLASLIDVAFAPDAATGIVAAQKTSPDLILCDIDLGPGSPNGFEVVTELRRAHCRALICVHSNRGLPEDRVRAVQSGAEDFIPKPMNGDGLISLVMKALAKCEFKDESVKVPEVAIVDDNSFVTDAWKRTLAGIRVHAFSSPVEFWKQADSEKDFLERLDCVLTDYYFEEGMSAAAENGGDFAMAVKQRSNVPVLLSSDAVFAGNDVDPVDAIIGKDPLSWEELRKIIDTGKSSPAKFVDNAITHAN